MFRSARALVAWMTWWEVWIVLWWLNLHHHRTDNQVWWRRWQHHVTSLYTFMRCIILSKSTRYVLCEIYSTNVEHESLIPLASQTPVLETTCLDKSCAMNLKEEVLVSRFIRIRGGEECTWIDFCRIPHISCVQRLHYGEYWCVRVSRQIDTSISLDITK